FISFISWSLFRFNSTSLAICGRTVSSLKRNIILPMVPVLEQLGFSCEFMTSKSTLTVSRGKRKNIYYLFGGKDEASASLIQGMTLSGVMFDEVALMPRSFVEQALARCSVEGSKFWFNCNPDNPAHWFYKEWIKKAKEKNALYLHFTMSENPSLSKAMLARYEKLYSGAFYERFVLGKWVAAEGLVYPVFNDSYIISAPKHCEQYYVSCDYGTVNPSSFGLWGRINEVWYRIAEYYYDSRREGSQKTDEEYYSALETLCLGKKISAVICDPSAASFITCIRRHGVFKVIKARNDVIDGIRRVSDAILSGKLLFDKSCVDTAREFLLYRWDEASIKDCPKKENDHAMDDIRYFVSTVLYGYTPTTIAIAARR
ncbi:MAG: PBSX family phage terminase large subunit, partial [Oscillospiraceae bacterium]